MVKKGYFKQVYLDTHETVLMLDHETYEQYLAAQNAYENRVVAQRKGESVDSDLSVLPPECREIIEEGQKYIQHIHACNARIANEVITEKLNRLEMVVTRIFAEVSKDPSTAKDLKKLMNYYLPTTQKLLDAYCLMDEQGIQGSNIETTKQEIENALDTINAAFENLLDRFFQDTAWDISSDISVLNTMLAQEGLTEGGMTMGGR